MLVTLPVALAVTTNVETWDLLQMLAQSLGMEYALDSTGTYSVWNDPETQELKVTAPTEDGSAVAIIDDRGSLFLALRQVAACMKEEGL